MDKITPLFSIAATNTGGRNGHSATADQAIQLDLSVPKAMGGPGKAGTVTPEHLFACGYAACFGGALDYVGKQHKRNTANATITCEVSIGKREPVGFGLAIHMKVEDASVPQVELEALTREAHDTICPYSHAIRNNVAVDFEIKGS